MGERIAQHAAGSFFLKQTPSEVRTGLWWDAGDGPFKHTEPFHDLALAEEQHQRTIHAQRTTGRQTTSQQHGQERGHREDESGREDGRGGDESTQGCGLHPPRCCCVESCSGCCSCSCCGTAGAVAGCDARCGIKLARAECSSFGPGTWFWSWIWFWSFFRGGPDAFAAQQSTAPVAAIQSEPRVPASGQTDGRFERFRKRRAGPRSGSGSSSGPGSGPGFKRPRRRAASGFPAQPAGWGITESESSQQPGRAEWARRAGDGSGNGARRRAGGGPRRV